MIDVSGLYNASVGYWFVDQAGCWVGTVFFYPCLQPVAIGSIALRDDTELTISSTCPMLVRPFLLAITFE
jgi:hypothetical protein